MRDLIRWPSLILINFIGFDSVEWSRAQTGHIGVLSNLWPNNQKLYSGLLGERYIRQCTHAYTCGPRDLQMPTIH